MTAFSSSRRRGSQSLGAMEPFMEGLKGKRVILSGCGGGCDVLGTTVIYQQIKETAKRVGHLNASDSLKWESELLEVVVFEADCES